MTQQFTRRTLLGTGGMIVATGLAAAACGSTTGSSADDVRKRLGQRLLTPTDSGFNAAKSPWNLAIEQHPKLVVAAQSADDVRDAVRLAVDQGLPVGIQDTGHGAAVPADGALLVSTKNMTDLSVDAASATARFQPGVSWAQVIQAAAPSGLAPLTGSSTGVGATGYLTGGGLPVLARTFGLAADHVRSMDLVTADGQLRRLSPTENPELFWAVRGGKGSFGIVVSTQIDLMRVARLYGGGLMFPGANAAAVLHAWAGWVKTLPDEMNTSVGLLRFPDLPAVPEPLRGKFMVHVRIAYVGSNEQGAGLVAPLRALNPVMDTVADMPYSQIGAVHNDPTDPSPSYSRVALLSRFDGDAVDRLVQVAGPAANLPPGLVELRCLGGALARAAASPSAIGHRDAGFSLFLTTPVLPAAGAEQAVIAGMQPWAIEGALPNFLGVNDTTPQQIRACYTSADFDRLTAIKTQYDPHNLFRIGYTIPPRS